MQSSDTCSDTCSDTPQADREAVDYGAVFRAAAQQRAFDARRAMLNICTSLSQVQARDILVEIQQAYESDADNVCWLDRDQLAPLFDVGDLIDRLEDAATLSPDTRRTRVAHAHRTHAETRRAHAASVHDLEKTRRAAVATRHANERAFLVLQKVGFKCVKDGMARGVLACDDRAALAMSPCDWHALRLEVYDENVQRALLHRIQLLTKACGHTAVPRATHDATRDLFDRLAAAAAGRVSEFQSAGPPARRYMMLRAPLLLILRGVRRLRKRLFHI